MDAKKMYLHYVPVKVSQLVTVDEPAAIVSIQPQWDTLYSPGYGFTCPLSRGLVAGMVAGLPYHPGLAPTGTPFQGRPASSGYLGFTLATYSPFFPSIHFADLPPFTSGGSSQQPSPDNSSYDVVVFNMSIGSALTLYHLNSSFGNYGYSDGLFVQDLLDKGFITALPL